jgi:spore germination protein KC
MRLRKIKNLLLILILLFSASGCWDALGISKKNIVTTVIVDKTETGYAFTIEIARVGKKDDPGQSSGTPKKNIIIKSFGKELADARADSERQSNKIVYLGADQCVIFTPGIAGFGISEYVYRLRQTPEYRKTVKVVQINEKPEDILNADTENDQLVGIAIEDLLENLADEGHSTRFRLADLLEKLASPNPNYIIPVIGLKDNLLSLEGYSVFKKDKSIGTLAEDELEGILLWLGEKPKESYTMSLLNNRFTVMMESMKKKVDVRYQNGIAAFDVKAECKAMVLYMAQNAPLTDDVMKQLNAAFASILEQYMIDAVRKSQSTFRTDYLDFYTYFRIRYPDVAKKVNWEDEYPRAIINVDVDVDLKVSDKFDYNPQ